MKLVRVTESVSPQTFLVARVRHHQRLLRFLSVRVCPAESSPYRSLSNEQCKLVCSFSSSSPQTVQPFSLTPLTSLPSPEHSAPPAASSGVTISSLRATHVTVQAECHLSKCWGPEMTPISESFRFGSICID